MNAAFTIDLIEQKGELLFLGGSGLLPLQAGATFTTLLQDGKNAKSRRKLASVSLTIETLIADGEPVDSVEENQPVLLAVAGDATPLLDAAQELRWRRKSQRLLRTSDDGLTLALEA